MDASNAANNLLGRTLASGWKVTRKIEKESYATGQFFSVCYEVEKDGIICFLKAFDFAKFLFDMDKDTSMVDIMARMLNAYKYEKDLSDFCRGNHVTKVIFVKEAGEEVVDGYTIPRVPYLIFDMVDGDVRKNLIFSEKLDFTWRLKSLHDIAVGLKQLHQIEVSHQDLKPSNILLLKGESKIGDLGRSKCLSISSPFDDKPFTGDHNYAPPEILYGYYIEDWHQRVFATDCYLLGSMVVFYFAGISMSAMLSKHIPNNFRWDTWHGNFDEVKPYLVKAFYDAIQEFENQINDEYFKTELKQLVERLCYPFPEKRGHPKNILSRNSNYNLERFVTKFDVLYHQSRHRLKKYG